MSEARSPLPWVHPDSPAAGHWRELRREGNEVRLRRFETMLEASAPGASEADPWDFDHGAFLMGRFRLDDGTMVTEHPAGVYRFHREEQQ